MNLSNEFVVAILNREKFLKFEGAKDEFLEIQLNIEKILCY